MLYFNFACDYMKENLVIHKLSNKKAIKPVIFLWYFLQKLLQTVNVLYLLFITRIQCTYYDKTDRSTVTLTNLKSFEIMTDV